MQNRQNSLQSKIQSLPLTQDFSLSITGSHTAASNALQQVTAVGGI